MLFILLVLYSCILMLVNEVSLGVKLLVSSLVDLLLLEQRLWHVAIRFLDDFG